jgi:hypothetical protein
MTKKYIEDEKHEFIGGVAVIYQVDQLNHRFYQQHLYKLILLIQIPMDYQSNPILIAR